MANVSQIPKSQPNKNFKRANILFAMMLISVLSTGLMFYYNFSLKNIIFQAKVLKEVNDKKQSLILAHIAFQKLKSIAGEDACIMYERGDRFYFKNNHTIDKVLSSNMGYCVKGLFETKSSFACCFDRQGLRKPLCEVMQYDNYLEYIPNKGAWPLAKKRWEVLKHKEFLHPDIFPPLIWKMKIFEENNIKWLLVHFLNPYDRKLQTGETCLKGINICPRTNGVWFCAYCTDPQELFQILNDAQTVSFKISNGYEYIVSTEFKELALTIMGNREVGFIFNSTERQQAPTAKWRKHPKTSEVSVNKTAFENLFLTQTWIDELDACFFGYNAGEPYSSIGNFNTQHEGVSILRNYFWNNSVANPEADIFYFNGPRSHIEERLRTYGVPQEQIHEMSKKIVNWQPYASATSFLEKIITFADVKKILPCFEHLSHRTERFKIESWCGDYVCEMKVERNALNDTERDWKIIRLCWNKRQFGIKNPSKK